MGTTEHEILKVIGEKGKAGKTLITQRLGISHGYADIVCKSLIREGYLRVDAGKYFTLAPKGAKLLSGEGWKFIVDKSVVEEVARGVAKEVTKELKGFQPAREYAPRCRRRKEDLSSEARRAEEEGVQIKTSFIPPIELEEVSMESNLERVTTEEKDKFNLGGTIEALKKIKGR
jgi:predicted transcriptional regulator